MPFDPHKPPLSAEQWTAIANGAQIVQDVAAELSRDLTARDAGQGFRFPDAVGCAQEVLDAAKALMSAALAPIPALVGPCLRMQTASPPPVPCGQCTTCIASDIWAHYGRPAPLDDGFARVAPPKEPTS